MKLLFDQNISHRILKILSEEFVGSTSVKSQHLIDSSDKAIWDFAKKANYTIVTQDSDFNDLNSLYGFPPKIIWIRTGNLKTEELANILKIHYTEFTEFEKNPNYGCFEILTIKK
jgi:predicted nuclease of predicted toxin-antitoxin system